MSVESVRINVDPTILNWVKQNTSALNEKWRNLLNDWIADEKTPTLNQLQDFSKASKIPFGYFFLKSVPDESIDLLNFRTVNNVEIDHPSRELIDTIQDIETKQVWLSDFRKEQGFGENEFNGAAHRIKNLDKVSDKEKAEQILELLELKPGWNITNHKTDRFKTLRNQANIVGITVMKSGYVKSSTRRALNEEEFRAFAITDTYAPFIFINSNDSYKAILFSLAHELVHLWYGNSELLNSDFNAKQDFRDPVSEQAINHVVEELLFPRKEFLNLWKSIKNNNIIDKIVEIASKFGASPLSTGIRAYRLKLISSDIIEQLKHKLHDDFLKNKKTQQEKTGGPNYYSVKATQLDHNFVYNVASSAESGTIPYDKAFELLNVKNISAYDKFLDKVKGAN